jgi:hypothetical protein
VTPAALSSRIESVTVYRRGARVTRVAELAPAEGGYPAVVRLGGLPLGLDDGTVRARVEAAGGEGAAAPVAFDLRVALDVPGPDAELRPADDVELEGARAEVVRLDRQLAQIRVERARLDRLQLVQRPAGAEGEPPPLTPAAARRSLVRFRAERGRALDDEARAVRGELDAAMRRREVLEDRELRATGARQAREHELRKAVVVSLRGGGKAGSRCTLVVEYVVPGACWAPVYSIRLDAGMTAATLAARAVVAQDSGEDWPAVALTLSTAEAQGWTELPELRSLRIGRAQPRPARVGWRPPPTGVDQLYRDWDRAFAARARRAPVTRPPPMPEPAPYDDFDDNETLVDRKVALPPPPPASMSTPMAPQSMPMEVAAMAPPPMPMRPPAMKSVAGPLKKMAEMARSRAVGGMPGGGAANRAASADRADDKAKPKPQPISTEVEEESQAEHGELVAGGELLQYGDLRMAPPSGAGRGRLLPAARAQVYLELLVEQRVTVRVDVLQQVAEARERAALVAQRIPPGCQLAWAEHYDYAYPADARVDVPSDGDFHSIPLSEREAPTTPLYVVVPRESTDVFRTAVVDNPLGAPLLPGPVDVYVRGEYLLTSRIDSTPPGGRFTLGLGVEQAIKVSRNTKFREETAGLMGGALVLHHGIAIEIINNLPVKATVEVRERVPVTIEGDDTAEVKVQASPRWEEWRQELESPGDPELRGGHRWRVAVAPSGREEVRADYEVRIASKHELMGGNRREA